MTIMNKLTSFVYIFQAVPDWLIFFPLFPGARMNFQNPPAWCTAANRKPIQARHLGSAGGGGTFDQLCHFYAVFTRVFSLRFLDHGISLSKIMKNSALRNAGCVSCTGNWSKLWDCRNHFSPLTITPLTPTLNRKRTKIPYPNPNPNTKITPEIIP